MGKIHDALMRAEQENRGQGASEAGDRSAPIRARSETERRFVPRDRKQQRDSRKARIVLADAESAVAEEYRTLRARIQSIRRNRSIRSIVVTSPSPSEGKTTTAINLALSFGLEREGRTCLVDADLRTPSVHYGLIEEPAAGLVELIETDAKIEEALVSVPDTRLSVITVRARPSRPSEMLASARMAELLQELESRFDTIIVDSPPVLGLPDATTLMDLCDAILLVVALGVSDNTAVETTMNQIDPNKAIGCVLNRSENVSPIHGSDYGRRNA